MGDGMTAGNYVTDEAQLLSEAVDLLDDIKSSLVRGLPPHVGRDQDRPSTGGAWAYDAVKVPEASGWAVREETRARGVTDVHLPEPARARKANTSMTITPGELRARTQPTILLRMTEPVHAAPGDTDAALPDGTTAFVFGAGLVVFAQYIGNGRLYLDPIDKSAGHTGHVVMASALNSTAEILANEDLAAAFGKASD